MKVQAPLIALMISTFAIGTSEFVIIGLLPEVAADLDVTVSLAGLVVSAYALGITFGAPILTALAGAARPRSLLLGLMAIFICGNLLAAISPGYGLLITARVLTAFAHSVFFSIGATIAAGLAPPGRSGSAIALMFTGLTVAMVTGVPLGTLIGQDFGWRVTFASVGGLGVIAFLALLTLLPRSLSMVRPPRLSDQFRAFTSGRLILVMGITALGFGGSFVSFTYLAPILRDVSGFSEHAVGLILVLYGLGIALGNILGGRLADRGPVPAITWLFLMQILALAAFHFTMPFAPLALGNLAVISFLTFAPVSALQLYILRLARKVSPEAESVASAMNISAFNIGIAFGSWLGGMVINFAEGGLAWTPLIGSLLVVLALLLTRISAGIDRVASATKRPNDPPVGG